MRRGPRGSPNEMRQGRTQRRELVGVMEDVEARSRLSTVLDVCEHEMRALNALGDPRLIHVLQMMTVLRAEIIATLATLTPDTSTDG